MCASLVRIEGKMKIISMCLYSSNSRTSYNTTLAFVKAQFSHLSSSRKKRTEHTHTHTHIKDRSSVLELFTLVFLLPNHAENSKWWLRWKDGRNHSFSDGKLYFIVTLTKFDFQRYIYFIRIFHSRFSFFLSQRCHLFSSHQLCTS